MHVEEGKTFHFGSLIVTGLSINAEKHLRESWPIPEGELFDKAKFEEFLTKLQKRRDLLQQQREDIDVMLEEISFFERQCRKLLSSQAVDNAA